MAKKTADGDNAAAPEGAAPQDKEPKKGKEGKEPKAKGDKPPKGEKPAGDKPAKPEKAPAGDKPEGAAAEGAAPTTTAAAAAEPTKKRGKAPGTPPRRGKKLRKVMRDHEAKLAKEGAVTVKRAIQLLKSMKRAKFDETVEVHMALGIDTAQADQMVRGSVALPHGLGKSKRVVVFCQGENVAKAKEAGADFAGGDDLIEKVQKEGWLEFDVALATQDMMGKVSRLGKVLGPRGLMPTPKSGTVIPPSGDVAAGVREFKAGKVEYRADKGGNVHAGVGKLSFDEDKLAANVAAFIDQIKAVKPTGVKGNYVRTITLSATMSPGVPLTI